MYPENLFETIVDQDEMQKFGYTVTYPIKYGEKESFFGRSNNKSQGNFEYEPRVT